MPPENGGYMVAAYVVTAVVLIGYAVLLVRRAARALRRLD
jgi:CcmD family protein